MSTRLTGEIYGLTFKRKGSSVNHYALLNVTTTLNDKYFNFAWQPHANWEDVFQGLEALKADLVTLKAKYEAAVQEQLKKQDAASTPAPEAAPAQ